MRASIAFLKQHPYILLLVAIAGLAVLRIAIMPFSPPGFFLDEAASGAHVVAMLQHGTNAHGEAWPLFSASLGGGYTTPIYLYPLTAWAMLFGPSELSLRMFSQISTIAAIFILALALKSWLGKRGALIAAVIGLALPWGWLQGSLAWDPALVPFFVTTGFLGFSWLLLSSSSLQKRSGYILLPLSLLALAYLYPPCRVTAPFLFAGAYLLLYAKHRVSLRSILTTCLVAAIIAAPLLTFILQPEALERSKQLSVFYNASIPEGIAHMVGNFFLMLSPLFLFVTGDPNLRHSTFISGMLGIASIAPLGALIIYSIQTRPTITFQSIAKSNTKLLFAVATFGIMTSLLGSALTNEGQPHSLRATAAWPFFAILLTLGWMVLVRHFNKQVIYTAVSIFAATTVIYAVDLASAYPQRAASSFDQSVREQIYNGQTPEYPSLSFDYYKNKS